ncbi:MAG: hypothetical protein ACQ9MH_19250 [Nitrospinales bacterium]
MLYTNEDIINIEDENELRRILEELPCCTTYADGDEYGDPLNLILIGDPFYTDGFRAVLFFDARPYTISDIEKLEWESPSGYFKKAN